MPASRPGADRPGRSSRLERVGDFAARRPWRILFVWGLLAGILGLFGLGLADKISNRPLLAEGTASKRAYDIATREFGKDNAVVILLRGPREAV
jgi:uncharacterized membrane protein YdfJ with MMPL/SSD domain